MNKTLFTIFIIFLAFADGFSQQKPSKIAGVVQIDNTTWMKVTEVSLKEWMDFIVNNGFEQSLFPDTGSITTSVKLLFNDLRKGNNFEYLKIVSNGYSRSESGKKGIEITKNFRKLADSDTNYFAINIPVTGITFKQAQKFCQWKQNMINESRKDTLTVRLPPPEIYKRVINNEDSLSKNCDCYRINCRTARLKKPGKEKGSRTQGKGMEGVFSYLPNKFGLYCIQGNAAEMTDNEGVAMGGSFLQTARESYYDQVQHYKKAEGWLGFRYIITLNKR